VLYGTKCGQLSPPGSPVDCQFTYVFHGNPSSSDVNFDCFLPICTRSAWTSSSIILSVFQLVACPAILRESILMTCPPTLGMPYHIAIIIENIISCMKTLDNLTPLFWFSDAKCLTCELLDLVYDFLMCGIQRDHCSVRIPTGLLAPWHVVASTRGTSATRTMIVVITQMKRRHFAVS